YVFKSDFEGTVNIYLRVSDDGLHHDGSRNVTFVIDDTILPYNHKSTNYVKEGKFWGWETLGQAKIRKGENIIQIRRENRYGAAFTMDKFVLSETELRLQ
ncbi:MAG: hypothetical protein HGA85_07115, partial [Nanoarchaeota archaeon]|nr:hypothetical protein [Nanoarchaeota archaeon]